MVKWTLIFSEILETTKKFISENPSVEINNFLKKILYSHQIKYNNYLTKN